MDLSGKSFLAALFGVLTLFVSGYTGQVYDMPILFDIGVPIGFGMIVVGVFTENLKDMF